MSCELTGHLLFLFALALIHVQLTSLLLLSWLSSIGIVDQKS